METKEQESVEDLSNSLKKFGTADYAVFIFMLVTCSIVGLYFGYQDHKKKKKDKLKQRRGSAAADYLMGGRNMQVFPVAMSLVASFVSGITLLGTSTEIYLYGLQYALILVGPSVMGVFMYYFIIPVFHDLKMTSMYEYLEARFDYKMRLMGSVVSSLSTILWLPIVVYVPALAFNQTTGIDIHIITPIVCIVCIFYTCVGGLKAVVWTDFIQIVVMYGVLILIMVKGTMNVGGLSVVIERNWNSGRIERPDFNIDPTIRHSFWTLIIGGSLYWINVNAINQSVIQRYMALKDVKSAQKSQKIYVVGVSLMISMCIYNGLLLFATYHDCDPLTTKLAKAKDQMVPLLVLEILKDLPGLPGVFIAGVFSAALSSLSTGLNSMSAVVLEDFFKPLCDNELSERATSYIMRGTVFVLGILSVILVYVVQHLGSVLQLSMSVPATCMGPLFGVFLIGLTLPTFNKKATFYAAIASCLIMGYLVFKAQADMALGNLQYEIKPMSVDGCLYNFTAPLETNQLILKPDREFHHISYLYYMPLGASMTFLIALILSCFFGFEDSSNIDPRLLAPFIRKYVKSSKGACCAPEIIYNDNDDKDKDCITHAFEIRDNKEF